MSTSMSFPLGAPLENKNMDRSKLYVHSQSDVNAAGEHAAPRPVPIRFPSTTHGDDTSPRGPPTPQTEEQQPEPDEHQRAHRNGLSALPGKQPSTGQRANEASEIRGARGH